MFLVRRIISHIVLDEKNFSKNECLAQQTDTALTRLIRNDSIARFSFELSGSLNYAKPCNSNFLKIFKL